ncbi:hypothetical protein U879_05870 [Defluviimonas sp. 20V17]|uniref:Uncharacterized protein n=2 Tax=Allgaiera indica TaxID=765699 RepID=A0AAN5A0M2_9RHOB|nr:hypothetical protein U879_05870 [Defluviimonas sp. 20V17]GHE02583.1 hypothetical protein GCM10008024_22650 [Allgaiera indica]SDX85620.1 hypothetical protein SAMN05444006_13420 [Allgaiera indica]
MEVLQMEVLQMMTPIEFWRAGFVFWTRAAEAQLEFASRWICAVGLSQRAAQTAAQKATIEALRAASVVPLAPNAISTPVPKRAARKAPRLAASRCRPTAH